MESRAAEESEKASLVSAVCTFDHLGSKGSAAATCNVCSFDFSHGGSTLMKK